MPTVLLVEDNPLTARAVTEALRRAGMCVVHAPHGECALTVLAGGDVDLVLTDIGMPRLDGLGLLEHVRRTYPDVPIVALTGLHELAEGFDAVVRKPCSPAVLVGEVLQVLADANKREGRSH